MAQRQDVNKSIICLEGSRPDTRMYQKERSHLDSLTPLLAVRNNIVFNPKPAHKTGYRNKSVLLHKSKSTVLEALEQNISFFMFCLTETVFERFLLQMSDMESNEC